MTWFITIGRGFIDLIGNIGQKIHGFINGILSIIQNIISYIYAFYSRIWYKFYENPYAFIHFLANVWVLML